MSELWFERWHSWYAWRPVRLLGGGWAWRERIERRQYAWYMNSGMKLVSEYRRAA